MNDEQNKREVEPVEVWEASNRLEAEIVKGRLESEGIPAMIHGEAAANIFGFATGELAKAVVLVPSPLAERALEILQSEGEWLLDDADDSLQTDDDDDEMDADQYSEDTNAN